MVAGERGALDPKSIREIRTQHSRWIATSLNVYQQYRVVGLVGVVAGVVVAHVDMCTVIGIAGAALPAGAPRAVRQSRQLVPSRSDAGHGLRDEVGHQGGDGRIHVQRHEKEQG